ncbi:MAG TPA: MFS transporter [Acidimicrobiales bacterium]|nr:MFS transporter [Acidimicrobiales bacterium]
MARTAPDAGWQPLKRPPRNAGPLGLGRSPFSRLAIVHVLAVAGDTLVTMALAGSLFFSISPQAARGRVALYLLLTVAPFAVVAPLLSPVIDRSRGGRRALIIASAASRAVVCLSMAGHLDGLMLFPEAFAVLVLSKAHMVTKSALVPSTVSGEGELVGANSRLALLSVLAGFAASIPGIIVLKVGFLGAPWVVRLAALTFAATAIAGFRLARPPRGEDRLPPTDVGEAELHAPSVRIAATAMGVLRAVVGFLTFFVAFSFRNDNAPAWWFGLVLAVSMAGSFAGAAIAPRLRQRLAEERILQGSLGLVVVTGLAAIWIGGLPAFSLLAVAVGLAASAGKLAFDSIVQRDAPDAVRGRTFARFETRFQLAWVAGAALPVAISFPIDVGMGSLALIAALALSSYLAAVRAVHHRHPELMPHGGERLAPIADRHDLEWRRTE